MMHAPRLIGPRLALGPPGGTGVVPAAGQDAGAWIVALELEIYRPGGVTAAQDGWLNRPRMAARPLAQPLESTDMLRASDLGYRTEAGVAYPPTLEQSLAIDRQTNLHPSAPAAAVSWGTLRLANLGRQYDGLARGRNSDGRPLRILMGRRRRDEARGIELDPPYASLAPLMTGVAEPWSMAEGALSVPVRDASYLLERPLQQSVYAGTGGLEGGPDLKGRRKPRARGGANGFPIRDVSPVWVDRANGILQVSDAPGVIVSVSEAGDPNQLVNIGEVEDFGDPWPAGTPGGRWRFISRADGLWLQLESPTTAQITADVIANFPSGVLVSTAAGIARQMMLEDLGLPLSAIDLDSFAGLDAAYPWQAGDYWDGSSAVTGDDAVGLMLASLGAKLIPARSGRLRAWALRALPVGARPAATYTTAHLVSVEPSTRLSQAGLSPPPYRWRVGWGRNNTVIGTSDVDPDVAGYRLDFITSEYRQVTWLSTTLAAAWRKPNDPDVVPTRLLDAADAQALADALGAQWGAAPRLYDCVLPLEYGLRHEIGDALVIAYPLDDLDGGRIGQVVGEQTDLQTATSRLTVLI
ncbi:hypothetical protein HMPREF9946_02167 [Acetobacteraceae bacterium AT-5844]|nr:hypothetical protein HMPREF9946_02167 [Acetobacteraceae bacterium AT-5844]